MTYFPRMGWTTSTLVKDTDHHFTPEIDLFLPCDYMQIILPILDTTTVGIYVSPSSGGTFARLGEATNVTSSGAGGYSTTFNVGGFQFVKIQCVSDQTSDRVFYVRGYRN